MASIRARCANRSRPRRSTPSANAVPAPSRCAPWRASGSTTIAERGQPATLKRNESLVNNILAELLDRPLAGIDEAALLAHLLDVRRSGRGESASRARVIVSQIFDHAIATRRATVNPAKGLVGNRALRAPRRTHYAALPWQKLGAFARALELHQ